VPRPDASRRPGEWIGRYAKWHLRTSPKQQIDTFVLTHLHDDHMGTCSADSPLAADGTYRLTGVSDVAEIVPIRRIIDRGFPDYNYPVAQTDKSALNYIAFVRSSARAECELSGLQLDHRARLVCTMRLRSLGRSRCGILLANGEVWTGDGEGSRKLFPGLETLTSRQYPTENDCSVALRFGMAAFVITTGAILRVIRRLGRNSGWMWRRRSQRWRGP